MQANFGSKISVKHYYCCSCWQNSAKHWDRGIMLTHELHHYWKIQFN